MDKFYFPRDKQGCTYLRPWTHKDDTWSFYFVLEKRARVYGRQHQLRNKKIRRNIKKSQSAEPVGILQLYGVVPFWDHNLMELFIGEEIIAFFIEMLQTFHNHFFCQLIDTFLYVSIIRPARFSLQ
ncbi:unnamed protein product [Caenorhabditis angaria]|uniref:Uncharacterized protein n=1 Tax=Caenorhabditis angaria TaxID=860376 RepID=A0A9P1N025_9PELO|nr:unnamed protein product [Caenorhabditis angaria]